MLTVKRGAGSGHRRADRGAGAAPGSARRPCRASGRVERGSRRTRKLRAPPPAAPAAESTSVPHAHRWPVCGSSQNNAASPGSDRTPSQRTWIGSSGRSLADLHLPGACRSSGPRRRHTARCALPAGLGESQGDEALRLRRLRPVQRIPSAGGARRHSRKLAASRRLPLSRSAARASLPGRPPRRARGPRRRWADEEVTPSGGNTRSQ